MRKSKKKIILFLALVIIVHDRERRICFDVLELWLSAKKKKTLPNPFFLIAIGIL
jgi:hypothetical protein